MTRTHAIHHDAAGHALSGATVDAALLFEQASHELRCLIDDRPSASSCQ